MTNYNFPQYESFYERTAKCLEDFEERITALEIGGNHATQERIVQENHLDQHLGVPHREDLRGNEEEVRQGESGQAISCGGTVPGAQVEKEVKAFWEREYRNFGLAQVKEEGCLLLPKDECYFLAGPMTGLPNRNALAFNEIAAEMRAQGFLVINPVEIGDDLNCTLRRQPTREEYLRTGLQILINQCTAIIMLPGWRKSKGARVEHRIAKELGYEIWKWRRV